MNVIQRASQPAAELDAGRVTVGPVAAGDGRLRRVVRLPGCAVLPVEVKQALPIAAYPRVTVPVPVTLLLTWGGLPLQTIAPLPGTAASRLVVAVTWMRPEPVRTACTSWATSWPSWASPSPLSVTSSRAAVPATDTWPLPETVTVSWGTLIPVTEICPSPLRFSAVSDGTLTSTLIGARPGSLP